MHIHQILSRLPVFFSILAMSACSAHLDIEWRADPFESGYMETSNLADITADAMALAERVGNENLLVVFDIDNTILAMEQGLGADQWYEWQKDLSQNDRCSAKNVGDRFAVQGALYFASAMRPTQADAAGQVKAIQDSGIPVIVLTSRGHVYRLQTFRELRRNGFNFSRSSIGPPGGYEGVFEPVENGRLSRYEDGVFMTAGQHKGEMLHALLQKTGTDMPAAIIMVDDKQENLEALMETFDSINVPVRAWRYSGEDFNVKGFDADKAHAEWKSIEAPLRQIQKVFGPDNYDLETAVLPSDCP